MDYQQRAEAIAAEILALPAADRRQALTQRCGHDPALMEAVAAILRARESPSSTAPTHSVVSGAGVGDATAESAVRPAPLPERVGRYRIHKLLGQGGFGVVYLASSDDGLRRAVALKILRPGSANVNAVRRFRRERAILPSLHHPNIAGFLDADETPDGQLYFVMEYVEGQRITDYCDQNGLTVQQRIALFQKVCDAVQHAHDRLVLHRDLKPANILVDRDGEPKLLDFGIARTLSRDAEAGADLVTVGEEAVLTPDYASPEQLRGAPLTVASDVYSLGVILYELLTGQRPYVLPGAIVEASRHIEETRLVAPSDKLTTARRVTPEAATASSGDASKVATRRGTSIERLRRQLAGDIDNIVLTALRREPARRYGSARELAEDLGRHVAGEPVRARGDSWTYRTGKFVRRHRVPLGATALVVAAGIFAVAAEVRSAGIRADQANERLERDKETAGKVAQFLASLKKDTSGGRTKVGRQGQLEASLVALATIASEEKSTEFAQLLNEYVAALSDSVTGASAGSSQEGQRALEQASRAVDRWTELRSLPAAGEAERAGLAVALRQRAQLYIRLNNESAAMADLEASIGLLREAGAGDGTGDAAALRWSLAEALLVEANLLQAKDVTSPRLAEALAEAATLTQPPLATAGEMSLAAEVHERQGDVYEKTMDIAKAKAEYRKAVELRRRAADLEPTLYRQSQAIQSLRWLTRVARDEGRLDEAEAVLSDFEALVQTAPFDPEAAEYLDLRSQVHTQRGQLRVRAARFAEAAIEFGAALEFLRESLRYQGGEDASLQRRLGQHHLMRAEALLSADQRDAAAEDYKACIRELTPLAAKDYRPVPLLATAHAGLARVAWRAGASAEAEAAAAQADALRKRWAATTNRNASYDAMVQTAFLGLEATRAGVQQDHAWLAATVGKGGELSDEDFAELAAGVIVFKEYAKDRSTACALCRQVASALDDRLGPGRSGDMHDRLAALRAQVDTALAGGCE